MKCKWCDEDLVCASCGKLQTPVGRKKKLNTQIDGDVVDAIDKKAKAKGMSRAAYIEEVLKESA
jgi:predicted HicB family RNase H-like nuclease